MKRYLITGASRGIGRAIAQKLAAPDVELLLHGRDTVALAETCKAVGPSCANVVKLIHDLATEKGVTKTLTAGWYHASMVKEADGQWRMAHLTVLLDSPF